jgi:hypothetical protein
MVKAAKAGIVIESDAAAVSAGIEAANAKSETNVDRKPSNDHRAAVSIEPDKGRAAKSDPATIPAVVCIQEHAWRVYDTVGPSIGRRSFAHVPWPWCVTNIVVVHLNARIFVVIDTDNLIWPIDPDVKARMIFANPVDLGVEGTQPILALDCQIMQRRLQLP